MIKSLHIENYALISLLDIDFYEGFSVITGETGAGKSIILGAIGLLKGQRADMRSIKTGEQRCVVEAVFDVANYQLASFFSENDLDFDGRECIIRRELTAAGKSRAFINDTPVSAALLKQLGDQLLDVHSQHQNLLLNNEQFQINVLDIVAADQLLLNDYKALYADYRKAQDALRQAIEASKQSHDDEDYWRFQLNQLTEANLDDEHEQALLEQENEVLEHAEEIRSGLFAAQTQIDGEDFSGETSNVLTMLKHASTALQHISDIFPDAKVIGERLESSYIELKDVAAELESCADRIEADPERLSWIADRLNVLYTLERKHGVDSIAELKAVRQDYADKLNAIDHSEELIAELTRQTEQLRKQAVAKAKEITAARTEAASKVDQQLADNLRELGMPNVRFHVDIQSDYDRLTINGADKVRFLFSANKNADLQDVSTVASGGEIARVMLSLKALIAAATKLPTIIFDEIDTGVSGKIAEKMASIMDAMGRGGRQVISITHLPQIASKGLHHYRVYKDDDDEATHTHIVELTCEQRVEEIAHMLSGVELTEAAIVNARELLKI